MRLTETANQVFDRYDKIQIGEPYKDLIQAVYPEFQGTVRISDVASYTLNKKDIFLKLDSGANFSTNLEIVLHELSHCLTEEIGHGEEFQAKLEQLRARANQLGYF